MNATMVAPAAAIVNISGAATATMFLTAPARAAMSTSGIGSTSYVLRASTFSIVTSGGSGQFAPSDIDGRAAMFYGLGQMAAVGYAFYSDAEVAGPAYEVRTAFVPYDPSRFAPDPEAWVSAEPRIVYALAETRTAVAPFEDRVYYTKSKAAPPAPPNRRRIL
jgi:hypothetical protein